MAGEVTFKHKHQLSLSPSFFLLSVCSNFFNLKKNNSGAFRGTKSSTGPVWTRSAASSVSFNLPRGVRTVFTNKITVTRLKIWFGNCSMGMFHFSVEYYGVATRNRQGFCRISSNTWGRLLDHAGDRAVSNHVSYSEIRDKRFHRAVLSDNRFTEKQRMTISPNSSNMSCKQLLNTWSKSSDSPSATLFYSWILWGLNSRWVWLLWHHTHPRAEKNPTAPGTGST